jgi:hypothetical protein
MNDKRLAISDERDSWKIFEGLGRFVVGDWCFGSLEFVIQEGLYFAVAEFDG